MMTQFKFFPAKAEMVVENKDRINIVMNDFKLQQKYSYTSKLEYNFRSEITQDNETVTGDIQFSYLDDPRLAAMNIPQQLFITLTGLNTPKSACKFGTDMTCLISLDARVKIEQTEGTFDEREQLGNMDMVIALAQADQFRKTAFS